MRRTIVSDDLLTEEAMREEQPKKQELKEKESAEARSEKDRSHFWKSLTQPLLGAVTALLIAIGGAFVAVHLTQKSNEDQEKLAVLRLLEVSKSDLKATIERIDSIGNAEINADNSQGCVIPFRNFPDTIFPYPIIFTDAITDKRVILNLSNTNLKILYPSEKKLDKYADAIMRMNYDAPFKETKYADYRDELKFLQLVLGGEIKYQKGKLSEKQLAKAEDQKDKLGEEQIVKANKSFKSEALKDSPFKSPPLGFNKGRVSSN